MGQKLPPALSPLSDKGSTFQVTQASLSIHAHEREEPGSPAARAAVGQVTQAGDITPGHSERSPRLRPPSQLRRTSAPPGAAEKQEGSAAGDLAGCRRTGLGRFAACGCSQAPRSCGKVRGHPCCCCRPLAPLLLITVHH